MTKKYYIYTYGCQMNQYDSLKVESLLENQGFTKADKPEESDMLLINTCSVRDHAEQRAWGSIGNFKKMKLLKPDFKIIVIGCMAERLGAKIIKRAPYVDLVVGPNQLKNITSLLNREEKGSMVLTGDNQSPHIEMPMKNTGSIISFVAAMKGCNCYCAYCIVPYTRGREESRSIAEITDEVRQLVEQGAKEIHLLGQNITNYGKDLGMKEGFIQLLEAVHNIQGVLRIKYVTPHPKDFSYSFIYALKNLPKVPEHFHLPVQSGNNDVLATMNRGYTTQQFSKLVEEIRGCFAQCSISTDVIVGFPTETSDRFKDTLAFFQNIEFDNAYITIYSPRPGTLSSKLYTDEVSSEEKKERHQTISTLQENISLKINQKYVGKTLEVLVEEYSTKHQAFSGRSRTNKIVAFKSNQANNIGKLIHINILEAGSWVLKGEETG